MLLEMLTPLLLPLGLTALAAGAILLIWLVDRMRDRVWSPAEERYGRGRQRALLIFQPSRRQGGLQVARVLAKALARAGHTVTVNRPSSRLVYDPAAYDLLIFGGTAYLGSLGKPLREYLARLRFTGKRVLLYAVGEADRAPELAGLRLCVPAGNTIRSIKVKKNESAKLAEFALG